MEPFIAEIIMFGGNFAPRSWAFCEGQLLAIAQNTALFSLIGTIYGGDGRTTFALPDLRGRTPIHPGNGPGLPTYQLGEKGGAASTALNEQNLPSHNHLILATNTAGTTGNPVGAFHAGTGDRDTEFTATNPGSTTMNSAAVTYTGTNQAFNNMQPFLAVNFIICMQGNFPSRS